MPRPLVSSLISAAGVVAVAYLAFVGLVFLLQSHLLFLPHIPGRALELTPEHYGLAYEEVRFAAADGVRLHGWWVPADADTADTVLILHGNAGNISHRLDTLRIWHGLGYHAFIFDYRGYGASGGRPSEPGVYRGATAAWRELTEVRGIPAERIVLFGRSLGGAVAVELATRVRPAALIVESTFSSVPDIAAELYPWLPVRFIARLGFDAAGRIGAVRAPVLVVHSRDDEIIPFHHGERIFAAAAEPKRLLELRGDHNTGFLRAEAAYVEGLESFLHGAGRPGTTSLSSP